MSNQVEPIEVRGKHLVCAHCGGNHFTRRKVLLNTRLMTSLNMDWLNKSAQVFACIGCGRLEWFLGPTVAPEVDTVEPTECVSCSATIPAGQDKCPKCGWSYKE